MLTAKRSMNGIIDTEGRYFSEFAVVEQTAWGVRYTDYNVLDMYTHNFSRIFRRSLGRIDAILASELAYRRTLGQSVVRVECFAASPERIRIGVAGYTVSEQIILALDLSTKSVPPQPDDVDIRPARSDADFEAGKQIDVSSSEESLRDFFARRYTRKLLQYRDRNVGLYNMICFQNGEPVGNCDLYVHGAYGKVEDFDVLPTFQRRGYGTKILDEVVRYAAARGVVRLYLLVDSDNSAIRMYEKYGFGRITNNVTIQGTHPTIG
ncbi:MAG: GNAT family N-acetyltransferase [Spirochaetales bacterium]|nr:GNAT family N-acetyltransferase [Spirochaetales bacterium]